MLCAIAFGLLLHQATRSFALATSLVVLPSIGIWRLYRLLGQRSMAGEAAELLRNEHEQFGSKLLSIGSEGLRTVHQDFASLLPWNSFDEWAEGEKVVVASSGDSHVTIPKRLMSAPMVAELRARLDRGCGDSAGAEVQDIRSHRPCAAEHVARYSKTPSGEARSATFEAGQVSWPRLILFYFVPAAGLETALGLDGQRVISAFLVVFVSVLLITRQPILRRKARRRLESVPAAARVFDVEVDAFGCTRIDDRGVEQWIAWTEVIRWSDEGDLLFFRTSGGTTYWFPIGEFPPGVVQATRSGLEQGGGFRLERSWREHFRLIAPQHFVWR